jgi:hypothetical protein
MCFLHVELRCKCYAKIIGGLKDADFRLQSSQDSEDRSIGIYAATLREEYHEMIKKLQERLMPSRLMFVSIGLPRLVYLLHIRYVPKVKWINDKGSQAILRDLVYLREEFSHLKYQDIPLYTKASWIASNVWSSPDRIIQALKPVKKNFTFEEIEPMITMQNKTNENSEAAREKLKQVFFGA